jgi:hypothetical protein
LQQQEKRRLLAARCLQCTYDPKQVSYEQLMDLFFSRVDPTTLNRWGGVPAPAAWCCSLPPSGYDLLVP